MKTVVMLGLNCAYGNTDASKIPISSINFNKVIINYPPTQNRDLTVWPETVAAIKDSLAVRPKPHNRANIGFVFITKYDLT